MGDDIYPEHLAGPPPNRDEELRIMARTLVVKRTTLYLLSVLTAVVLIGGGWLGYKTNQGVNAIRETQQSNTPIGRDTHSIAQYVKNCQDPNSECSQKNRQALARALAGIDTQNRRVSSAAAACSLGVPQDLNQHRRYLIIKHCVDRTLTQ